jgi:CheY-like chemotaxis protein
MLLKALKNNTALQYKIDENVPVNIISDPSRIHQILVNLLDNAIKFSPNGAVQLLVSFQENAIHFLVKDNGIGISEDQQEKIFESFIQADNSKIKNIIGTGLGLAISKKLCYLLGSSIQVSSKLGEGSSFSFKINYEKSVGTSLNQVNISPLNIKEFIKEKNILLVEDNEVNQMVIAKMFSKSAISITICNNGKEAIDLLEKKMFDLILMDVQMPIMDGITATKIIRSKAFEKEKYKKIKVIALTADVFEETRSAFFEAGVDDYIYKPVKEQQLFEKLYEHLS